VGTLAGGGVGTFDHLVAAAKAAGFSGFSVVPGTPRSRVTTPNDEADRLDRLWGGTGSSDFLRRIDDPDSPVEMDMTIYGVELVN
jgi:hypothetical protein